MPYAPGIQYRGDVHLAAGIRQAGEGLAGLITNFRKDKAESDFLDKQVVGLASAAKPFIESGELEPSLAEEIAKFPGLSLAKKRGVAANALFQIQTAKEARQEKADTEDRNLRRGTDRARLDIEAARFNEAAADRATDRAGREQFNAGLAEYLDIPETIRRPARDAVPGIAARAGIATPAMASHLDDARLRDMELGIRDRAVTVQERLAGVSEDKLTTSLATVGMPKPEAIQRMMNEVMLRLSDPLRSPIGAERPALQQRLKDLESMLPENQRPTTSKTAVAEEDKKKLDPETAKGFLKQAGGDKDKARKLAKDAGYEF